ncbi:aldo/keto reductase [Rubrivirga sp. S365]|uniref:aldo/keto reductase n=1 Tax=Rubrivirga sp. S365 TaxID=3076080 RepID=UPI0028C5BF4A|nr:aldo/keto reductase [Rubrivirga sp. S365]MDT7855734.1 aldo/keto reductase [Rubrivirga sp. S365]
MDTRRIGSLTVSTVGLGCNNFGWHIDEAASREVVSAALDAGVTHFDTAEVYGEGQSEEILGRALGARRDDVTIATKFGHGRDATPAAVRRAIEGSLGRLGTDRVDLYYLHKPDPDTPIADTLGALDDLVREGKVREVACSNLSPEQLREAEAAATGARFVALQNEYSLLHRDPEGDGGTLAACRELGLAFVPYFPLKSGLLTGKYRRGDEAPEGSRLGGVEGSRFAKMGDSLLTADNLETVERLIAVAKDRGHTVLDLAFAYLLAHEPVASVIAGATKPSQVRANVDAAGWALSPADLDAVDEALQVA